MEMTNIPYTIEAITEYLRKLFPNDGDSVDDWVKGRFHHFKQIGRNKLPITISVRTLRFGWAKQYKWRGRTVRQWGNRADGFDPSPWEENNVRHLEGD